ncbi:hypothetical protein AZE42_07783 [Rhizopogon vesiculosus]|uniref:Uncharacterized protein n=1 Tax=Rhizopogon vesiculosus TaxID=180088 RepID=A0A1J8QIS7_9AGAM|nr:hypothetical protein AZE42_07783 [Rhizopogon vesiculosus]
MTWEANRKTTRIEDLAYSLIGIFDISMTIAYGEGDRAFKRFMAELIQNCKEWQILIVAREMLGEMVAVIHISQSQSVAFKSNSCLGSS